MTRALDTGQEAYDLLRRAQEAAYRLPADFGGFAADERRVPAQAPSAVDGGIERRELRLCGHVLLGAATP